jgi:HEAT repeat protein
VETESRKQSISIDADTFTLEELRAAVFGDDSERLSKMLAVQLLGRKDYPEKLSDLRRVLLDEGQSIRARHSAAIELGRMNSSEAAAALREAAGIRDDFVRSAVLLALQPERGSSGTKPEK